MIVSPLDDMVQQLLQALPGDAPTGRWMRYERAFMEIAKLREEDDPGLPMGEWERPMVKADWRKVADACVRLLQTDTKDFQLAGWLCDAWIRIARVDGLCAGLALIGGFAERYWEHAWPAIEDGDADRRIAPFVWLNANLTLTLRMHVVLLPAALHRAEDVSLLDWERAPTADDAISGDGQPRSRRDIRDSVRPVDGDGLRALSEHAADALARLEALSAKLDDKLGQESPSLSKLAATLEALRLAADSLLREIPAAVVETAAVADDDAMAAGSGMMGTAGAADASGQRPDHATASAAPGVRESGAFASAQQTSFSYGNREQAYQALLSIAAWLQSIEPHSPAPYMVKRAAELGQMSLPQMLNEVTASAGSMEKFFELLGIKPPR